LKIQRPDWDINIDRELEGFIKPEVCCLSMVGYGILFFALSIFIDYRKQLSFRDLDGNNFNMQPIFTLPPDEDVLREEKKLKEPS